MNNDFINISSIETHLDKVIRKHICKQSFAGTLPSTLDDKTDSYVVIECASGLNDYHAFGGGIVNIVLYTKPIANGAKNVAAMSRLEKSFSKVLKEDRFDDAHYKVSREFAYELAGYDNTYNMHYIVKAIRLTVI